MKGIFVERPLAGRVGRDNGDTHKRYFSLGGAWICAQGDYLGAGIDSAQVVPLNPQQIAQKALDLAGGIHL